MSVHPAFAGPPFLLTLSESLTLLENPYHPCLLFYNQLSRFCSADHRDFPHSREQIFGPEAEETKKFFPDGWKETFAVWWKKYQTGKAARRALQWGDQDVRNGTATRLEPASLEGVDSSPAFIVAKALLGDGVNAPPTGGEGEVLEEWPETGRDAA